MVQRTGFVFLTIVLFGVSSAWSQDRISRIQVAGGLGYLTSGDYFTGPASTSFANSDAAAVTLEGAVRVHRFFDGVLAGAYAQPEWRLSGVPLVGSISLPGAHLWLGDVSLRGRLPLSQSSRAVSLLAQAGAGVAHYAVATSLLGNRIEADATNFAFALGAGIQAPLTRRLGLELLAKDYIASFKSVHDLEAFGVEGRRAHTVVFAASVKFDL
jgi:hypothetical protein